MTWGQTRAGGQAKVWPAMSCLGHGSLLRLELGLGGLDGQGLFHTHLGLKWPADLGPDASRRSRPGQPGLSCLDCRRVAGWAGPEPSLRQVRQAWPAGGDAFQDKKACFLHAQQSRFARFGSTDSGSFELDADGPPDRILGQPTWVGGGGGGGAGLLEKRSERPWPL